MRRSDDALPKGPPVLTGCIVTDCEQEVKLSCGLQVETKPDERNGCELCAASSKTQRYIMNESVISFLMPQPVNSRALCCNDTNHREAI